MQGTDSLSGETVLKASFCYYTASQHVLSRNTKEKGQTRIINKTQGWLKYMRSHERITPPGGGWQYYQHRDFSLVFFSYSFPTVE